MNRTTEVELFWDEFAKVTGVSATEYAVFAFGDGAEMADELLALVLDGRKRATAGLLRDYQADGESVPKAGDYSVVLDGVGAPRCIIKTTQVEIKPLSAADETFAWDEGEGDRTLSWWMDAHVDFFTKQAEVDGFDMHPDIDTVFERFDLVWPRR